MPTIVSLCDGTGAWSQPYVDAGYRVVRVTLPGSDVRTFALDSAFRELGTVRGVLAAPPCTEFAGSGARWWAGKDPALLAEALDVFDACHAIIDALAPAWWALENPVGRLRRLRPALGAPRLTFDPCDFGDPWRKRTLLWGNFTIPAFHLVEPLGQRPGQPDAHYSRVGGRSEATKRYRSQTPPGFARAFFEANP